MNRTADVLVVGGGVIGASIAHALTAAGARNVVLCDRGGVARSGATAQSGGLVRMHHTNPWQARLAWESLRTYAEWPDVVGEDCGFHNTGFCLVVGHGFGDQLRANVRMLQELGIPLRELSAEDFRELQPFCGAEDVGGVAYEPFSGYADPRLATLAFVRQAARRGLRVLEGVEVTELLRHGDRIVGVQTDRGEIRAGTVVLAGNIGAVPLASCAGLLLPVRPRRIGICFTEWVPAAGQPPLCTYIDDSIGTYFRPEPHGRVLVGIRSKERAAHTDPAEADHTVRLCEMLEARARLARRIPGMREAEFVGARAGVDGYTPDEHALIGRIREMEGLYVAVGFSGGGFKVAPAVGRAVASELLYEREAPVLKAFRPDRFEAGCTIRAEHAYAYM